MKLLYGLHERDKNILYNIFGIRFFIEQIGAYRQQAIGVLFIDKPEGFSIAAFESPQK
jgi:hypothetical protein